MKSFKDSSLKQSVALPNAANTTNTSSIDLGSAQGYPVTEKFGVRLSTVAGTGANNKNVTIVFQGSNEAAANFTNITGPSTVVIPEVATAYAATNRDIMLPPGFAKRYIRVSATGEANGGNAGDTGTMTIELLF
jgi:hypothetical protein